MVSGHQSLARLKSWKDESALLDVVKTHIKDEPYRTSDFWMQGEMDELVEKYEDFFTTVAGTGYKLSKFVLVNALKKFFKTEASVLAMFATTLMAAEQYCRIKCKSFVDGSHLHCSVKNVVLVMIKAKPNKEQQRNKAKPSQQISDSSDVEALSDDMDTGASPHHEAPETNADATDTRGSDAGLQALRQLFSPDRAHLPLPKKFKMHVPDSPIELDSPIEVPDSPAKAMPPQVSEPAMPLHQAWGPGPCHLGLGKWPWGIGWRA